jgi:hypothetical protein
MNARGSRALGISKLVACGGRRKTRSRACRWASAAFSCGVAASGLVLTGTGSAAALTPGGGPPLKAAPIDFGLMTAGDVSSLTTAFDATVTGPVTVTSPDPAVFAVTGLETYTVSYQPVDLTGDLQAGHRLMRTVEPVYTPDQQVTGGGPVNVAQGERVVVRVAATAPAWTPPAGLEVDLTVDYNNLTSTIPVSVGVSQVEYSITPTYTSVKEGGSVDTSLDIDEVSGPATDVTLEAEQYQDIYGLSPLGMGVAYPAAVRVTQGHNFVTLRFQSTPGMVGTYDYLIEANVFGSTQDVGTVVVDVLP